MTRAGAEDRACGARWQGPRRNKGLSVIEYATLIASVCVVAASIGVCVSRGMKGRIKSSTDAIGGQFSSRWSDRSETATSHQRVRTARVANGESVSTLLDVATTKRDGYLDEFSNKRLTEEQLFE